MAVAYASGGRELAEGNALGVIEVRGGIDAPWPLFELARFSNGPSKLAPSSPRCWSRGVAATACRAEAHRRMDEIAMRISCEARLRLAMPAKKKDKALCL
jgi:hypothetical protein